jgi:putative flippase GtrA
MTSPEIRPRKERWVLAFGYGLAAEIATIATIVVVVMFSKYVFLREWSEASLAPAFARIGAIMGFVGGTLFTFVFARRLMSRIPRHFIAHGVVVAFGAIALSIAGSLAGHGTVPASYLAASALKIIAGAAAGYLYERSVVRNRMV